MDEVFHLSDRITVLRDGKLVKTLTTKETTPKEVTHLMVGREIEAIDFGSQRPRAKSCSASKISPSPGPATPAAGVSKTSPSSSTAAKSSASPA